MNVNSILTKDYENQLLRRLPENKPNQTQSRNSSTGTPWRFIGDIDDIRTYSRALSQAKVPAEMHIYQKGRHGFGLGKNHGAVSSWPVRCADWMRSQGLLDNKSHARGQK